MHFLKLSIVKILPKEDVHTKKAICNCVFVFKILFHGNELVLLWSKLDKEKRIVYIPFLEELQKILSSIFCTRRVEYTKLKNAKKISIFQSCSYLRNIIFHGKIPLEMINKFAIEASFILVIPMTCGTFP